MHCQCTLFFTGLQSPVSCLVYWESSSFQKSLFVVFQHYCCWCIIWLWHCWYPSRTSICLGIDNRKNTWSITRPWRYASSTEKKILIDKSISCCNVDLLVVSLICSKVLTPLLFQSFVHFKIIWYSYFWVYFSTLPNLVVMRPWQLP